MSMEAMTPHQYSIGFDPNVDGGWSVFWIDDLGKRQFLATGSVTFDAAVTAAARMIGETIVVRCDQWP
jgi:hypothetical protein